MGPAAPGPARPTLEAVAARAGRRPRHRLPGDQRLAAGQPAGARGGPKAIDELGFVPNRAARTLVTQRTDSVALVVVRVRGAVLRRAVLRRRRAGDLRRAHRQRAAAAARAGAVAGRAGAARELPDRPARRRRAAASRCTASTRCRRRLEARGVPTVLGGRPPGGAAGGLRGRRQPGRGPAGGRAPGRRRPPPDRDHPRAAGHDRGAGAATPATSTGWPGPGCRGRRSSSPATSARTAARRGERAAGPRAGPGRGVRRRRTRWRSARCGSLRAAGRRVPGTSRWSASTTRRPRRTPIRR